MSMPLETEAEKWAALYNARDSRRNALAALMVKHGFVTGHGDTFDDLMREFDTQLTACVVTPQRSWEGAAHEYEEQARFARAERDEALAEVARLKEQLQKEHKQDFFHAHP